MSEVEVIKEPTILTFKEFLLELEDAEEVEDARNQLSQMLAPYGLSFNFGDHGGKDRIIKRERSVTIDDLTGTMGRFLGRYGNVLEGAVKGDGFFKATIKDYSNNINMVVDLHNPQKELYLVTIQRKAPNTFKTSDFKDFRVLKVF